MCQSKMNKLIKWTTERKISFSISLDISSFTLFYCFYSMEIAIQL